MNVSVKMKIESIAVCVCTSVKVIRFTKRYMEFYLSNIIQHLCAVLASTLTHTMAGFSRKKIFMNQIPSVKMFNMC